MNARTGHFDPRAWLLWWVAASLPALTGRNPFPLVMTMLVILLVRSSVPATTPIVSRGLLQLFVVIALIGVLFNVLTVHAGDIVLFRVPEGVPIAGGDVTLNAIVYGLLGAVAILTLVLAGIAVAEQIDWSTVMRLLPDSLLGIGVAGSIAFAFFPQMIGAFRDIREARILRGAPLRTPTDYAGVVSPMLASGLDRAVTLSELLEVRAFGGYQSSKRPVWRNLAIGGVVVLLAIAAYAFSTGEPARAALFTCGAVCFVVILAITGRSDGPHRTRYAHPVWTHGDTFVCAGAVLAIVGIARALSTHPDSIRYEPYPDLALPAVSLSLLIALIGLAFPAIYLLFRRDHFD